MRRRILALLACGVLLPLASCKVSFSIAGVWDFTLSYKIVGGSTVNEDVAYELTGDESAGTVSMVPDPGGFSAGTYQVSGSRFTASFTFGRPMLMNSNSYDGQINDADGTMAGTMSGQALLNGVVSSTWTGTFTAAKRD
jgi:hypothetical protein